MARKSALTLGLAILISGAAPIGAAEDLCNTPQKGLITVDSILPAGTMFTGDGREIWYILMEPNPGGAHQVQALWGYLTCVDGGPGANGNPEEGV